MTHVLIVTEGPNAEDLDADVNWYVDGSCEPECTVWYPCGTDGCAPTPDESDEGQYERHGLIHKMIDGYWMTESSGCGLFEDSDVGGIADIAEKVGVGVHGLSVDYEGDGCWYADQRGPDAPDRRQRYFIDPDGQSKVCTTCGKSTDNRPCPEHQPVRYWWSVQR